MVLTDELDFHTKHFSFARNDYFLQFALTLKKHFGSIRPFRRPRSSSWAIRHWAYNFLPSIHIILDKAST